MSILASIKEDRKMSFNHWRFKVLHWAFNVKDAKRPEDTGLPKYLYTHYCPLFHLTNLIAILSPLILLIRVIVAICGAFVWAFGTVDWFWFVSWIKFPELPKMERALPTREELKAFERRQMIDSLIVWHGSFDSWWSNYEKTFSLHDKDAAWQIFDHYMPRILEARERRNKRKEWLKQKLIFWTNFSRVFLKWTLNLFYIALAAFALYLVYLVVGPIVSAVEWIVGLIVWFFTEFDFGSSLSAIWFVVKFVFAGMCMAGITVFLVRIGWVQKFLSLCWLGLSKITLPGYLVGVLWGWVSSGWRGTMDFISMFYEENCPPIILVSPEDEAIDKIEKEVG